MFGPHGWVLTPLLFLALVAGAILTGFCVQHDANHSASFRSTRYNHLLGWSSDALLGISSYAWRVRHNVAHHTYTNIDGHDNDITQMPIARLVPAQTPRPWYRFQHFYIWPLYSFMGLRLQWFGDFNALRRGSIGSTALRAPRRWDLAGFIAGKAIFFFWALLIPLLFYPWWVVLASFIGVSLVLSLVMVIVFQLAHCVEEAASPSADELRAHRQVWAVHQVESTVDFCPRNPVLTWFLGGLNYQIEHHLFPRARTRTTRRSRTSSRRKAAEHGVRYTVQASLRDATPLARPAPAQHGRAGPAGRARDGLTSDGRDAAGVHNSSWPPASAGPPTRPSPLHTPPMLRIPPSGVSLTAVR